jgi:hypothetical protein
MSAVGLLMPILNGGIQNVNFVNGRVLTAEDMTAERAGNLQRQRLMGTALGDGVANGLEVTLSASSVAYGQQVVHVTAGLAVNRNGDMLQLPSDTDITLTATLPAAANNGGLFTVCQPPQTQLTNPGIYVLTVMPASGYQGQVPVTQLNSSGVATSCSSRFATAGVQFRLSLVTLDSTGTGLQQTLYALGNQIQTQLNTGSTASSLAPSLSQFRNGLAYACFGTETLATYGANPFGGLPQASTLDTYGLMDDQRTAGLMTNCEVPLALAYWSQQGIQFLDMWSVRRPVFPMAASEEWPIFSSRRRSAEGLAMFLQFEDQIEGLASSLGSTLSTATAQDYFFYLPSAGLVPIANSQGSSGFDSTQFFVNSTHRHAVFMEGARVAPLMRTALEFPPIDLSNQDLVWIYEVRQNQQTIDNSTTSPPQFYYLFTNGHMPFQAAPHFDLSHWDYANFI